MRVLWPDAGVRACLLTGFACALLLSGCEQPKYDPSVNAPAAFEQALSSASEDGRHLMVVFGADWCPDCRKLHENLHTTEVSAYLRDHMNILTVDVGDKNRNLELASRLGVSIGNGIPVAVFFGPDGKPLGATNEGQLEPSRHFTSRQILKFLRTVVDERRITQPAS